MTKALHAPQPSELVEHFLAEAISNSPQPLKDLALFLSSALSEDDWKTADRLLLALALRTQASDSWRPIAEHDNSADEVLVTVEGRRKPIVAWRHHPSSRTDKWLSVPGNYRVYPTAFHPLPALRPQTAESGK